MASKHPYPVSGKLEQEPAEPLITRVFESSCPNEINLLLDAGASFLGTAIRKSEEGQSFVYAVGIPDKITDLPRWGAEPEKKKTSAVDF